MAQIARPAPAAQERHGGGEPSRAIVLIGFMGAGKSTVARELAEALGVSALDSDALLEERLGHSIAEEFERSPDAGGGEHAFRVKEEALVCELLEQAAPGSVIALGGGSVGSERVRRALEPHLTVLLDVEPELAWARVGGHGARPLAREREDFMALHAQRRGRYLELADAVLPALAPGAARNALGALRALAGAPRGTRLLWASAASGEYPVFIGRRLLGDGAVLRGLWPLDADSSPPFVVSEETVAGLYGACLDALGTLSGEITLTPGEGQKTLAGAERVWHAMVGAGVTRAGHVVALGGGVVGDLAGFCAATYQRGVPVVQVPTTLLAQVDSAYGGKTGVDLPQAKNYVGAFHQPAGVLADLDTLATLPAAELASGWVEVLKSALIAGGELWEEVSAGAEVTEGTILACAATKLAVVAADERDDGARQVLNLGHTVGHAIETATGYSHFRHGEAVGLGLLAALRLSGADELRARARELLMARGLPVSLAGSGAEVEEIVAATARDKKRLGSHVPFVLLRAPGQPMIGCAVEPAELQAAVAELAR